MESLKVTVMPSTHTKSTIALVHSVRKPGFVLKFYHTRDNKFRCYGCEALGKDRTITIVDGVVVGRKHTEDDHHPECLPIPEAVAMAQKLNREMRQDVRETGKRPREAYTEMMSSVPKKFRSSVVQSEVRIHSAIQIY
jgi:hypothetical protein